MRLDSAGLRTAVGRRTVRSVSKLLLGASSLVAVLWLASLLPGADRLLPGAPVSFAAIVSAVAAVAVAGLLVYAASGLAALTRMALDGSAEVVEHVAAVVHWVAVLAAVLVAHRGTVPAAEGLLGDALWLYDLGFLLAALVPLGVVAGRLYAALDPAAEAFADRVVGRIDEADGSEDERRSAKGS